MCRGMPSKFPLSGNETCSVCKQHVSGSGSCGSGHKHEVAGHIDLPSAAEMMPGRGRMQLREHEAI